LAITEIGEAEGDEWTFFFFGDGHDLFPATKCLLWRTASGRRFSAGIAL
jgi:hypothetical protein